MLIGANKGESGFVSAAQSSIWQGKYLQWNLAFRGRNDELVPCFGISLRDQQSKALTEVVIER